MAYGWSLNPIQVLSLLVGLVCGCPMARSVSFPWLRPSRLSFLAAAFEAWHSFEDVVLRYSFMATLM